MKQDRFLTWNQLIKLFALYFFLVPFHSIYADSKEDNLPVNVHGFMTSGATKADNATSFNNGIQKRINYVYDSTFGLNISKRLSSEWDIAAQYLSQFRPTGNTFDVDWAIASYYPVRGLSFQVGKHKLPVSIISDYAGIGKLYPWVRPPMELYNLDKVQRFHGGKVNYEWTMGSYRTLFSVYGGAIRGIIKRESGANINQIQYDAYDVRGTGLSFESTNTLLRFCYLKAITSLGDSILGETNFQINRLAIEYFSAGLRIDWKKLSLYSEFLSARSQTDDSDIAEAKQAVVNAIASKSSQAVLDKAKINYGILQKKVLNHNAYYATLGYKIINPVLLTYTFSQLMNLSSGVEKSAFYDAQSSNMVGISYEFNRFADVKFEYQRTYLPPGSFGLYTYDALNNPKAPLARNINIFNVSLDFMF